MFIISVLLLCNCSKQQDKNATSENKIDKIIAIAYKTSDNDIALKKTDSIYEVIKDKPLDALRRKQLLNIAGLYFYSNAKNKCAVICDKLLNTPTKKVDYVESAFANYYLAYSYYLKEDYASSFKYFLNAEKNFRIIKNYEYLCYTMIGKSDVLYIRKDYANSETNAITALQVANKIQNKALIISALLSIGNANRKFKNYQKATEYYDSAVAICERENSSSSNLDNLLYAYSTLANMQLEQSNFKNAIYYATKGLKVENLKKLNPLNYAYLLDALAYSQFKQGNNTVKSKFEETLAIGKKINSNVIQITAKTRLGEWNLAQKDTIKANQFFNNALQQAKKFKIYDDELILLKHLSKSNLKSKNGYLERYIVLNDSLQEQERIVREKFARLAFETDEIIDAKKKVEETNSFLSNTLLLSTSVGILFLVIVLLGYNNIKNKARNKQIELEHEKQIANTKVLELMLQQHEEIQLAKQIEKDRISRDLHDGIMGKIAAVRLSLFPIATILTGDKKLYLNELSNELMQIGHEIRNIAHDLQSNLLEQRLPFISFLNALCKSTQQNTTIVFKTTVCSLSTYLTVDSKQQINLYRTIQETFQNILKHAKAAVVLVDVKKLNHQLVQVSIKDDGIGFDKQANKAGIGIDNMKKRMLDMHGSFEIISSPNNGTEIILIFPI